MRAVATGGPRLLHTLPGRVRIHLPGWSRPAQHYLETQLRQVRGVRSSQANPLTGNILIHFDPRVTDEQTLLAVLSTARCEGLNFLLPSQRSAATRQTTAHPAFRDQGPAPRWRGAVVVNRLPGRLAGHVGAPLARYQIQEENLFSRSGTPAVASMKQPAWLRTGICTAAISVQRGAEAVGRLSAFKKWATARSLFDLLPGGRLIRSGLRCLLGGPIADVLSALVNIVNHLFTGSPFQLALSSFEVFLHLSRMPLPSAPLTR